MHNENIGMGDLQPLNIMVSEDLNLTLIDFETALPKDSEESVTLQTPGFSSKFNKNNEERDWYSLKKILRYCVLPMGPVTNLDKYMFLHQDRWIKRKFGRDFLFFVKDIMNKCNQHLSVIEENTNNLSDIENYEAIKDPSLIISKMRSEERRVGKEGKIRCAAEADRKQSEGCEKREGSGQRESRSRRWGTEAS